MNALLLSFITDITIYVIWRRELFAGDNAIVTIKENKMIIAVSASW